MSLVTCGAHDESLGGGAEPLDIDLGYFIEAAGDDQLVCLRVTRIEIVERDVVDINFESDTGSLKIEFGESFLEYLVIDTRELQFFVLIICDFDFLFRLIKSKLQVRFAS